ncbi:zinc finger, CCHC-type containing protein [Tanacetum coccineum]
MKVKESLNVTFNESPPPPKTSPLEDDDLVEEEVIKVSEKKPLGNDVEDEILENDEIINIKESKSHPLENVIGNLNQITLRSQAQDKRNFFCFLSTIEPKNVVEALKDKVSTWKTLGGNTRDSGLILEETGQDCKLAQRRLEELLTEGGDGVRIPCDAVWIFKRQHSIDLNGATRNTTRLCLYHFSFHDQAINSLDRLPTRPISTWDDLTTRFLAQFFPPERTAKLQNDILMFQQHQDESLYDTWNHFKDLLQKVPHHAGGRLRKLRAKVAWETIKNLAQYEGERWNELIFPNKGSPDYIDANLEQELETLGRHLEEIHVTWAQFWKKLDKIANWHNEGLKNCSQKVETTSRFLATPSGFSSDGVETLATASDRSQPNETLEDSVSQDKEDYTTCARSIRYCFDHNSFRQTRILTIQ